MSESARPPTAFQRLTEFARRVIAGPKAEIDEQAKRYRKRRTRKRRPHQRSE
jgi:hypothetical protein